MAEPFTSYQVDNDRKFRYAITRAQVFLDDLRAPFTLILADFYRSEQAIFKLKGPGQYPPFKNDHKNKEKFNKSGRRKSTAHQHVYEQGFLSPYQLRKIKKYGFDYPLLVATGRLAASLLSANAPGSVAVIGQASLIVGTTVEYGIYHQSDQARKKIPLRKFLFIGPESSFATDAQKGRLERWMKIMEDAVMKGMRDTGSFSDA